MIEPGTQIDGLRIERPLGRGGMGVVYEATQLSLERRLAVKVLRAELGEDPRFVERFRREGRLQAGLDHPHVLPVYEAGESEHGLYLAMRLVRGKSLAELLSEGSLDGARALRLLGQVAGALDAAHRAGLVHRDVKPRNVLVDASDHAYLADFGLTRVGGESGVTASGELVGTVAYLAPEVIAGQPATAASDRYAFAAMLFECLVGETVFPRESDAAVLYAHTSERRPRISERRPELPRELDGVLARALDKDPAKRPDSAGAIIEAAERALGGETLTSLGPPSPPDSGPEGQATTPSSPGTAANRRASRGRSVSPVALLAAAALGAAVTGAAMLVFGSDRDSPTVAEPALPVPEGAVRLGSALRTGGASVDCDGRPIANASPCSIAQAALPGARLVAPRDGAIYGWTVRGAHGELALQVFRRREGITFQSAKSQYEFVPDPRVHRFRTNLPVERGDTIGVEVTPGARVGVRQGVDGATTERWIDDPLRGGNRRKPDLGPGTGFDHELLLQVDYFPGARQRLPRQVFGFKAAAAPRGRVRARRTLKFRDGRSVEIAVVEVGREVALDLLNRRGRVARVMVPGLRSGGQIVQFATLRYDSEPALGEASIEWVNEFSARKFEHFFGVDPRGFELFS